MYNSKIDNEEYFESLIMDTDFSNRSVLQIICNCYLEPLLSEEDSKSENIINTVYIGKDTKMCDGNVDGYSNFLYILSQQPKINRESTFESILNFGFSPKL